MLLNSLPFLAFFAGLVVLYYLVPSRWRWVLLLIASLYFYSTFDPRYVVLLLGATAATYAVGIGLSQASGRSRRLLAWLGVVVQLSVLVVFKYFGFLIDSVTPLLFGLGLVHETFVLPRLSFLLPVGLSFYIFSCISYIVDVARRKIPAERHFGHLALYVSFFPKLIAGPIERAEPFLKQAMQVRELEPALVTAGAQIMLWGLFKKVVIADRLADLVAPAFGSPAFQSPVTLVLGVYFYAFQIYCDFSGYSDIAIGGSMILGIKLMDNFRRPYLSQSVPEFWSARWHISLAKWFRDYLYIPMGGNRVSRPRWYFNQMVVFLVSGLWHGANWTFVVWGALNGLYQIFYHLLARVRKFIGLQPRRLSSLVKVLSIVLTFHLISLAWIFFRADTFGDAMTVISRIVTSLPQLPTLLVNYGWSSEIILSLILIVVLMIIEVMDEKHPLRQRLAKQRTVVRWGIYYAVAAALLVLGAWNMSEFVYMQF